MNDDFYQFVSSLWENRPVIIVLFSGGLALFLLSVINTFRHRRRLKRRHRPVRFH